MASLDPPRAVVEGLAADGAVRGARRADVCEQLDYNLLFRWFLDLNWDEPAFDHSTFSRNRMRLLKHDVAGEFFRTVVAEARELKLTSDEHFIVDGPPPTAIRSAHAAPANAACCASVPTRAVAAGQLRQSATPCSVCPSSPPRWRF